LAIKNGVPKFIQALSGAPVHHYLDFSTVSTRIFQFFWGTAATAWGSWLSFYIKLAMALTPNQFSPMLATLADQPIDAEGWLYEVKWDGYRALSFLKGEKVEIRSRNNKSFNNKFYPVRNDLARMKLEAVFDGEIVAIGASGISDFGRLQNWRSESDGELRYYVFDILEFKGKSLLKQPLSSRKQLLEKILPESNIVQLSKSFNTKGKAFYKTASELGLEGIVAKHADSVYTPGMRSREWLKIKIGNRHEVVIGGYTANEGSSKAFSSLLVGVFTNGKLEYRGKVGTGFSNALQKKLLQQFKPLIRKTSPFVIEPDINSPSRFRPNPPHAEAVWIRPELVCEVEYTEMTADGVMRHPSFKGMRSDKAAVKVVDEKPVAVENIRTMKRKAGRIIPRASKAERKTLLNPNETTQVKKVNGVELSFSNLNKIFWPKEKYEKRDLINYYYQVAPYILPYLEGRPQSLNRFPNGINGKSFYQKDVTAKIPDWIETFPYHSEKDERNKKFLVVSNEASLLFMANLGCIEINPWSSKVSRPDFPDWCVIDLDPDGNDFKKVLEAALVTREVLEHAGIEGYPKTSGSTGIHIYIPLGGKYDYEHSKEFARLIATLVHRQIPRFTSIERATKDRKGKIYIDFLQNRPQATLAAPYALRPKPGAPVSTPVTWDEVKRGFKITDFNIKSAIQRFKETGDLFKGVLGKGIDMRKVLQKLTD